MTTEEIITALRNEAAKDPVAKDTFTVFAMRQRARNTINLTSLHHKMVKEGFKYERGDYVPFIKALASLGLGTLDVDQSGRIRGLKDIRMTLQSIGSVACGGTEKLQIFKIRNRFYNIPTPQPEPTPGLRTKGIKLEFSINNKPIKLTLSDEMSEGEIATLIAKLRSA